jgi:hypothetical protein
MTYRKLYEDGLGHNCHDYFKPPCFKSKCDKCPFRDKCENAEKKFFDRVPYWGTDVRMD